LRTMPVSSFCGCIAPIGSSRRTPTTSRPLGRLSTLKAKAVDESSFAANTMHCLTSVMLVPLPPPLRRLITGGHNLICIGGLAAALGAVERLKADPKLSGQVIILGTPAEEGSGSSVRISSSS
jgi:hypothetical protein